MYVDKCFILGIIPKKIAMLGFFYVPGLLGLQGITF